VEPETEYISQEELKEELQDNYKATKSRGNSVLPPQLLKFLGSAGIGQLARFLNESAIKTAPPASWKTAKVIPVYKGKGDTLDPENYRSIAITPPLPKVFMAVMNTRLTKAAEEQDLHAPTQAGFRKHHSTLEQAFILQTVISHSLKCKRALGMAFIDL
jgi:hypothetical protein